MISPYNRPNHHIWICTLHFKYCHSLDYSHSSRKDYACQRTARNTSLRSTCFVHVHQREKDRGKKKPTKRKNPTQTKNPKQTNFLLTHTSFRYFPGVGKLPHALTLRGLTQRKIIYFNLLLYYRSIGVSVYYIFVYPHNIRNYF